MLSLPGLRVAGMLQYSRAAQEAGHDIRMICDIKGWMGAHPAPEEVAPCAHVVKDEDMWSLQSMAIRDRTHNWYYDGNEEQAALPVGNFLNMRI